MSRAFWGTAVSVVLTCVGGAAQAQPLPLADVLSGDDECAGSDVQDCTLNALQSRGVPTSISSDGAVPEKEKSSDNKADLDERDVLDVDEDGAVYLDLPADWDSLVDFPNNTGDIDKMGEDEGSLEGSLDIVNAGSGGGHCSHDAHGHSCYLSRACHGPRYCVIGNYMIVPGFACAGMEEIHGGNAGRFDYLMNAAKAHCGSTSCVLITNPVHHRTQDQMHIHFRHFNGGGHRLKSQLERRLCGTSSWQHFSKCGHAKARLYDGFPGVFSAVAGAYGGGNLANVGIAVFFTTKCGGFKTIVLATTHCSIEHSISR